MVSYQGLSTCEIQVFLDEGVADVMTNSSVAWSKVAIVSTAAPLSTPAPRSVKAKHPCSPKVGWAVDQATCEWGDQLAEMLRLHKFLALLVTAEGNDAAREEVVLHSEPRPQGAVSCLEISKEINIARWRGTQMLVSACSYLQPGGASEEGLWRVDESVVLQMEGTHDLPHLLGAFNITLGEGCFLKSPNELAQRHNVSQQRLSLSSSVTPACTRQGRHRRCPSNFS